MDKSAKGISKHNSQCSNSISNQLSSSPPLSHKGQPLRSIR